MINITPAEFVILKFIGKKWETLSHIAHFRGRESDSTFRILLRMQSKGLVKSKYTRMQTAGGKQVTRVWHKL